jgi:hypothetical protein
MMGAFGRGSMRLLSLLAIAQIARAADGKPLQLLVPDQNRTGLQVVEATLREIEKLEVSGESGDLP